MWSNKEINLNRVMHKGDRDLVAKIISGIAHSYDVHVCPSSRLLVGVTTYLFDISVTVEAKRTVEPVA